MPSTEGFLPPGTHELTVESLAQDLDILWALIGSYLVFFMQCGFAMLEAGSVQKKNTINILLKVIPHLLSEINRL